MQLLILISFILIAFQVQASGGNRKTSVRPRDNCTTRDLRPAFGPPRSQGNMGWCYANAAADLLSFQYRDELKGQRVSSSHIALTYNRILFGQSRTEGGFAWIAMNLARYQGLCPQNIEDTVRSYGPQVTLKERLNGLLYLKQNFDRTGGTSLESDLLKFYFKNNSVLTQMPIEDLRRLLTQSTEKNFTANFANYLCRDKKMIPKKTHLAVGMITSEKLPIMKSVIMSKVHSQLDHYEPAGIDYFASLFDADNAPKDDRHTSVVVGRRWNAEKNQCQILIRNSWGTGCHQYKAKSLEGQCEDGNVWVSQDVLEDHIYGLVYYLN